MTYLCIKKKNCGLYDFWNLLKWLLIYTFPVYQYLIVEKKLNSYEQSTHLTTATANWYQFCSSSSLYIKFDVK